MSPRARTECITLNRPHGPKDKEINSSQKINPNTNKTSSKNITRNNTMLVDPTILLPLLTAMDHFSVTLVTPLLHQYYKNSGISSSVQRELLSVLFASSQIIGGLAIGALSEMGLFSEKEILLQSFLGTAIGYSCIVRGSFRWLVFSRILVGLVKQTVTVGTSIVDRYALKNSRTRCMGRLMASSTFGLIAGPSVGGFLYKRNQRAPIILSSSLLLINFILTIFLLPSTDEERCRKHEQKNQDQNGNQQIIAQPEDSEKKKTTKKKRNIESLLSNFKACFTSPELRRTIFSQLIFHFLVKATAYTNMTRYYQELYDIQPHQRGYIVSYQRAITFIFQMFFVERISSFLGGDRMVVYVAGGVFIAANFLEHKRSIYVYLGFVCPMVAVANSILTFSLRSLIVQIVPRSSLSSVYGGLDVLQSMVSLGVPFYRTFLFRFLGSLSGEEEEKFISDGPSPPLWAISSLTHWCLGTLFFVINLRIIEHRRVMSTDDDAKEKKVK